MGQVRADKGYDDGVGLARYKYIQGRGHTPGRTRKLRKSIWRRGHVWASHEQCGGLAANKKRKEKLARLAPTLIRAFIPRLFHLFPPSRSNGVQLTRLVLTTTWTRSFPGRSRSKKQTANRLHHGPERLVLRKGQRPH